MKVISILIKLLGISSLIVAIMIHSSGGVSKFNLKIQRSIMRMIRDLSRHKARKRMNQNQEYALVPLLFGRDSLNSSQILEDLVENSEKFDIITKEELGKAKGFSEDDTLWISILGYVFDVKKGSKFYGKGGAYDMLAGRDATLALASGDLNVAKDFELVEDSNQERNEEEIVKLDEDEMAEAQRWLEYFASHQKYNLVGRLPRTEDSLVNIDELVNKAQMESSYDYSDEDYEDYDDDEINAPPDWHPPVIDDTASCPGGGN